MKVALYARTAIARPSEDFYSLRGQIAELNEWAETLHHQIVAIYEEVGSGISEERPEFNRMMTDAISAKHPFDAIVVCSMSRFTRDAYVFERSQARLQHAGVENYLDHSASNVWQRKLQRQPATDVHRHHR